MRTNLILLAIAIVLAIPTYTTLTREGGNSQIVTDVPQIFLGLSAENVNFVAVQQQQPPVAGQDQPQVLRLVFVRQPGANWILGEPKELAGLPVKDGHVEKYILDHMVAIRRDADSLIRSEATPEELKELGLDLESGVFITCKASPDPNAEDLAVLVKGKPSDKEDGSGIRGFYVRRADNTREVVLYEPREQMWNIVMDLNDWVELMIHRVPADKMVEFSLRNQKGRVLCEKKPGATMWTVADKNKPEGKGDLKQGDLLEVLSPYLKITADKFVPTPRQSLQPEQLKELILEEGQSKYEIEARMESGERVWLRIGKATGDGNHYAIASRSAFVFTLPNYIVNRFDRDPKDLFVDAPKKKPKDG